MISPVKVYYIEKIIKSPAIYHEIITGVVAPSSDSATPLL
jgi:hypothetical protein